MEIHQARLIVKRLTSAKAFIYAPHRKQFLFDETSKTAQIIRKVFLESRASINPRAQVASASVSKQFY